MGYLSVVVLLPLAALIWSSRADGLDSFWHQATRPEALSALKLTLGVAAVCALVNAVAGTAIAWVLVRDSFPGKSTVDAVIDLPFALPTIVAGLTLLALYGPGGPFGVDVAFTRLGLLVALLFVTLPFVVRAVQPVLLELDTEMEEAAASLGAGSIADLPPDRLPEPAARDPLRSRARLRPRRRGVRRGRAHLREHPLQDRGLIRLHLRAAAVRKRNRSSRRLGRAARDLARRAPADRRLPALEDEARLCSSMYRPLRFGALGYLALILLVPVGFVFYRAFEHGVGPAWDAVTSHQAVHALELTLLMAAIAVPANTIFGVVLALALVRTRFPGRGLVNAIVDLPLALSPVVAGLALFLLYGRGGWLGGLADHGIKILFAVPGMVLATMFVSLPFVVREVVPVLREIGTEQEQAAETLGASPFQTFWKITLPAIRWAVAYGVVLTTARAIGEFGAVSVVSGRIEGRTETLPLYVQAQFEQFNVQGAYAASVVLALIAVATVVGLRLVHPREEA